MNADTEYPRPQIHRFSNVLPPPYRTWLAFYDSIPVELREIETTRTQTRLSREMFEQVTGQPLDGRLIEGLAEYTIEREYLLARVGEELLPSRLHKKDVNELELAMYEASKNTPHSFNGAVNLLTPLWAVARSK